MNASQSWADAEWEAANQFTHVLVEAERSMFGRKFDRDLAAEIAALKESGVSVAYICHGTDIRQPDRHAQRTPWSPYPEDPRTAALRADAEKNLALLRALPLPTFVSTPDLLDDVPWATWCPVVVDPQVFATASAPFAAGTPRVLHVSSSAVQKGSHYIEPALAPLREDGSIEYDLVSGAPSTAMPGIYAAADIVLDQFRLGSYGVAACEAMAAGRVVVGHVLPSVRTNVRELTGLDLPIVEATPGTLHDVVLHLLHHADESRAIAKAGITFVSTVHAGSASARALIDGWIAKSR
ncbi:glycosyltransferase [Microbacterium profundi]|uniref:glycosyltransferase n=1 Tax=Microbacterium profundi TaxID=450380 RepID=UPI001269AD78|nr:hypothetical protein [Microbacterium profundi]